MDPTTLLRDMLKLCREIQIREGEIEKARITGRKRSHLVAAQTEAAQDLAEKVIDLDAWLAKGGFSPWGSKESQVTHVAPTLDSLISGMKCGACARIGTNMGGPMAHSPGCPNDKAQGIKLTLGNGMRQIPIVKDPLPRCEVCGIEGTTLCADCEAERGEWNPTGPEGVSLKDDGRCEHGMFRSGAGACPQCGA